MQVTSPTQLSHGTVLPFTNYYQYLTRHHRALSLKTSVNSIFLFDWFVVYRCDSRMDVTGLTQSSYGGTPTH